MLSRIVEWYNFLRMETEKCEFDIIANQMIKIDADLDDAIQISTWLNYSKYLLQLDIRKLYFRTQYLLQEPGYLKYIYDNIQKLHKRITMVQDNVKKILASISDWGSVPMYKRKDDNKKLFLDIAKAENKIKLRNESINVTKELIQRGMQENFCLFFDLSNRDDGNEVNHPPAKCEHNLIKRRMDLFSAVGKSAEDLGNKLEVNVKLRTTLHSTFKTTI